MYQIQMIWDESMWKCALKVCEICVLDCVPLSRLILILLSCTFSLMTLTAHIARLWNIDESFPVALLMQQLLWAVINRLFPLWLKYPSVSTCSSPWTVLLDTDAAHWGLRTDYSNSREGKGSVPDPLSGKLERSYSSCCHSLEPRQHFPWWLHNVE